MGKRRKSRRREKQNYLPLIAIGIGVLLLAFFLLNQAPSVTENPDGTTTVTTDLKEEDTGSVDEDGACITKDGETVGVCCWVWDDAVGDIVPVECKTADQNAAESAQAFFTFNSGSKLGPYDAFQFSINLDNTGNSVAEVQIGNVVVNNIAGGDAAGVSQIETKVANTVGVWKEVAQGGSTSYSSNPILIDVPTFKMTDGTYEVTFNIKAREVGSTVEANVASATVTVEIEQEQLSFSVDVTSI